MGAESARAWTKYGSRIGTSVDKVWEQNRHERGQSMGAESARVWTKYGSRIGTSVDKGLKLSLVPSISI
jgi:hypothetical protein